MVNGWLSGVMQRSFQLLTMLFMLWFSTFVTACIDHSRISSSDRLADVIIPQCVSQINFWHWLCIIVFAIYWLYLLTYKFLMHELPSLTRMHLYYTKTLNINDNDELERMEWRQVVTRIVTAASFSQAPAAVRKPTVLKVNAHVITNKLMRRDNYMIAMLNQNVLNTRLPWASRDSPP